MPTPGPGGSITPISGRILQTGWGNTLEGFESTFRPSTGQFSPGLPIVPPQPEQTRAWNFPFAYNTVWTPRSFEPITFYELRALAENYDILRLCIETRKDQIEKLEFQIKPRDDENPSADAQKRADKQHEFWERPDGEHSFSTWLRIALEDVLVLDAPAFEIRRQRDGQIIGLDHVDGSTIKLLVDYNGRRPQAPAPAFEQIIHGRPWRLLTTDELLYMPRNPRPQKIYGFGPVEQIITLVNIGIRREIMQLQHFTESNVPAGLLNSPDGWTPEQIAQFQAWFDSLLSGNTANRTHILWGPFGAKYQAFKEAPFKDGFDEWLARIVCYAFSLPPTPFVEKSPNRSSSETLQEAALAEGLAPLMGWVKRLVDYVEQIKFGNHDLEFSWKMDETLPPETEAAVIDKYVRNGTYSINEGRDILGMDEIKGGDKNMIYQATGPILVESVEENADLAQQQQQVALEGSQQTQEQSQELHEQQMANPEGVGNAQGNQAKQGPKNQQAGKMSAKALAHRRRSIAKYRRDEATRRIVAAEAAFRIQIDRASRGGADIEGVGA